MKKLFTTSLFFAAMLFCCIKSYGQVSNCPPNIDFEANSLANWWCSDGTVGVGTTAVAVTWNTAVLGFSTGTPVQQHLTNLGATDGYGLFPTVCPFIIGNQHSVMIGDSDGLGSLAGKIKYVVHVPTTGNNFNIAYYYAAVLESGGHLPNEQPNFGVSVIDSATGLSVTCATFTAVVPNTGLLPGFFNSTQGFGVQYRPWTPSSVTLNGLAGHTIYLEFSVADCAYGGHFGYMYVDVACSNPVIVNGYCPGSTMASLIGPAGFQFYQWWDSAYTTMLDTSMINTISPVPSSPQWFHLIVTPYQGWGCIDTLTTLLTTQPKPIANFFLPAHYCAGSIVSMIDSSISLTAGTYINSWHWTFGDSPPSVTAANPDSSNLQNPTHIYGAQGTYTVCLISKSNISCVSDTVCKTININAPPPPTPIYVSHPTVCGPTDTTTLVYLSTQLPGYTYTWGLGNGATLVSGNLNSGNPIVVKYNVSGLQFINFTAVPPPGDTTCWASVNIPITVQGQYPQMFIMGDDSICLNNLDTLNITGRPATCGPSVTGCSGGTIYNIGNNSGTTTTLPTPFRGFYTESKCQMLYLASELIAMGYQGGPIGEIAWNVTTKNSSSPACSANGQYAGFTISAACVPYSSIYAGTTVAMDLTTPLTTVYSTTTYNTTLGINNFVLTTPYDWDGVSNLLIQTCYDAGSSCWTQDDAVAKSPNPAGQNLCAYAYSDSYNGCDPAYGQSGNGFLGFSITERPDIILKACSGNLPTPTSFTWTSTPPSVIPPTNPVTVSPPVTTTYTVVGNNGGCTSSKSFVVNVLTVNTVNAGNDTSFCGGVGVTLHATATGPVPTVPVPCGLSSIACSGPTSTGQVGVGLDVSAAITPFDNNYNNHRMLMRYTAADIQAALSLAPNQPFKINSIQFNITTKNSYFPMNSLSISLGCFPNSGTMPTSFVSGLSAVYGPNNYSTVPGWNTFNFTTPYDWDGSSDLLVDICFASATFSANDVVQKTLMASNCVLWAGNPGGAAGCGMAAATPNTFGSSNLLPNMKITGCIVPITLGSFNFNWTASPAMTITNPNSQNITVTPTVTTTFTAQILGTSYCSVTDAVVVSVNGSGNLTHSNDTAVCPNQIVPLWAVCPGVPSNGWTWTALHGGVFGGCTNCPTPFVTVTGSDTIIVSGLLTTGCTVMDTIFIHQNPTPTCTFTVLSPGCMATGSVLTYIGNGSPSAVYNWDFDAANGGQVAAPDNNTLVGPHNVTWPGYPGLHTVSLMVSDSGCTSLPCTQQVFIVDSLTSDFSKTVPVPHCVGNVLNLLYTGSSAGIPTINYNWTDKNGTTIATTQNPPSLPMTAPGTYHVNLTTSYGAGQICPSLTTHDSVIVYPNPLASFTTNPLAVCSGTPINVVFNGTLNPGTAPNPIPTPAIYNWSWSGGTASQTIVNPPTYDVVWNTSPSTVPVTETVTLIVNQDMCYDTLAKTVTINPYPHAKINEDINIVCAGSPVVFTSTGSTYNSLAATTFNFTFGTTGTPATATTVGPHSVTFTTPGSISNETIYLQLTENGCVSNKDSVLLTVYPIPTANFTVGYPLPHTVDICSGEAVSFTYTGITNPGGNPSILYDWSFPSGSPNKWNGISPSPSGIHYTNKTGAQVHYTAQLVVNQDGCASSPFTALVNVNPLPNPLIVGPADQCANATTALTVSPAYNSYLWSNGATAPSISVTGAANVYVTVTDANFCSDSSSLVITAHPVPIADAGPDQILFRGNAAHLDGSNSKGGNSYLWSPAEHIDDPHAVDPNATPLVNTMYVLTHYSSAYGCSDNDTMYVTLKDCSPIQVPNAFTPNNNAPNNYFMILNPDDFYRLVRLEVYNRWGQLMYATNDKNSKGWDGKFRGDDQEIGTYIYSITAECGGGQVINLKGDVSLLR